MLAHRLWNRKRRDTLTLSTSARQAELTPDWKQEASKRLAAHKSRKGSSQAEIVASRETQRGASGRAAEAAARVAARYAKAPSYSEMLASEARAAVRAAEAASRAALEAQAAAESILAGLEAGFTEFVESGPDAPSANQTPSSQVLERPAYGIRWEADLPAHAAEPAAFRATHGPGDLKIPVMDWREPARLAQDALGGEGIEVVEPAQPLHANLIEFPRELVATRKVRPRLAEGPHATAGDSRGQLSIFEVDPSSISTQPTEAVVEKSAAWADGEWQAPEWQGIELEEQSLVSEETEFEGARVPAAPVLQPAPLGRRLMAAVVDFSLTAGALLAAVLVAAINTKELPAIKEIEVGAAVGLLVIGAVYQVFFLTLAAATPGMKYARISLCSFSDEMPTCAQRCGRLAALLLSLLPVGLGLAWAIFDEEHLSWHDRLSRTYQRMG